MGKKDKQSKKAKKEAKADKKMSAKKKADKKADRKADKKKKKVGKKKKKNESKNPGSNKKPTRKNSEPAEPERNNAGAAGDAPPPLSRAERDAEDRLLRDVIQTASKLKNKVYERELARLQVELVKLQEWIKDQGLKVVVLFEGRDAAGKGGVIKRITQTLNPRVCRVVALPTPTEREKTQWYFQRYTAHLPAAGEMVLFDRSWYNRAGVERVMGFASDAEYREFLRSCPEFERMLVRSGIILFKYWFSVSEEVQEMRFQQRIQTPTKRWKLSDMDLKSRELWIEYSRAKDEMFKYTDIKQAPWYVVRADRKKRARLNCIGHLLDMIPYEDLTPEPIDLPPRKSDTGYVRPPISDQTFVPEVFENGEG